MAQPFYDRLNQPYPWLGGINRPADFSVVNIGQIKYVFSFEMAVVTTNEPLYGGRRDNLPPLVDAGPDQTNSAAVRYRSMAPWWMTAGP